MGAVLTVLMQDNDITYQYGAHFSGKRAVRSVMKIENVIQRQTAAQHTPVHKLVIRCIQKTFAVVSFSEPETGKEYILCMSFLPAAVVCGK